MRRNTPDYVIDLARECRKNPTEAERILWQALRQHRAGELRFYRQRPILRYIADFYCHAARLVIEVDGGIHDDPEQRAYDEERNKVFTAMRLRVLRFSNESVLTDMEGVLQEIQAAINPHQRPLA